MSNALSFLGIAVVIAVVGGSIVALVHRSHNVAPRTAADEFRQVMDALAPEKSNEEDGGVSRGT